MAIWVALTALATSGLFAAGLLWAQAPRPAEGPLPPVLIAAQAPPGLAVDILAGAGPDAMQALPARIVGRAAPDGDWLVHQWPAFHASAAFHGHGVDVALDDAENRYRLSIDDTHILLTRIGRAIVRVRGLADGPHQIRLEKLSERAEPGRFGGFALPRQAMALPAPRPDMLIEFVGDSDTVGYGNTAPGRDCSAEAQFLATDTSRAYGPITARALGADYRIIAASGIGLVRNLGGGRDGSMSEIYPTAIPSRPDAPRAPELVADVIVIGLGSNDFARPSDQPQDSDEAQRLGEDFAASLLAFMRARRAEMPAARMVLLAFGEYGADLVAAHRIARDAFAAGGDHADLVVLPELARNGCHWHPSLNDHRVIADRLVDLLRPSATAAAPTGKDQP